MRARGRTWLRRLLIFLIGVAALVLLGLIGLYSAYQEYVVHNPGAHLEREDILKRVARESPIYYSDGRHKLGVFFGAEHRLYLKYDELPPEFVQAIVASEDARFWNHPGMDIQGIGRALVANFRAGRVVAGGSTITQQTAKNLYYRNERTYQAKLEELLNALRLEAHYSKQEILEFYSNQFHVHSNGRGLGIAARYFFDKTVKELTVLECAFLAGVVKGPFRYNPFVGTSEEARGRARERARIRTHYVLDRMLANGYLKAEEVATLKEQTLEFKEGEFKFDHNVILDHVFATLQEEYFVTLLQEHGIDNPATAGLEIITTVDREFQQAAEYGLRHNLSDVGSLLDGITLEAFIGPAEPVMPVAREDVIPYGFLEGLVIGPVLEGKDAPGLEVELGGIVGRVNREGLQRVANLLKQSKGQNRYSEASKQEIRALAEQFPVGRRVYVSVKDLLSDGTPLLDLEASTRLQGALVVLEEGRIRAMVGGQDNRNFNRAVTARRQLGSTFKPLTFAAALSLGWTATAALDNRRQGFPYQGQWYWPRPDHDGVQPQVSMAFSGATSENLTAVSLLYHLTDPLTEDQLQDLAERVGLAMLPNESTEDYTIRIRDKHGIIPSDAGLEEGLFLQLKAALKTDLVFAGKPEEAEALHWLPFGNGFDLELEQTLKSDLPSSEKAAREQFLSTAFRQLESLAPVALSDMELILRGVAGGSALMESVILPAFGNAPATTQGTSSTVVDGEELSRALSHFYLKEQKGVTRLVYGLRPREGWRKASLEEVRSMLKSGGMVRLMGRPELGMPAVPPGPTDAGLPATLEPVRPPPSPRKPEEIVLLEGVLSPSTVQTVRAAIEERLVDARTWPTFALKRLVHQPDFRVLVGMQYVIQLARAAGVKSPMKPVLSLTLGSNEISLLEAAMIYQTFLEGKSYGFTRDEAQAGIIEEIRTASGEVIYRSEARIHPLLDPSVGPSVGRILRGVVERGTAAKARRSLRLASPDPQRERKLKRASYLIPFMGKTGTTNDYLNVAFIGMLPIPVEGESRFNYGRSLTIAAYVGYDDNKPMKRGGIRIQGSSGALPAWLDAAQGIQRDLNGEALLKLAGAKPGAELPLSWPEAMQPVAVEARTGLRVGLGVVVPETPLPAGQVAYEVMGRQEGDGYREQDTYLPFTPWSKGGSEVGGSKLEPGAVVEGVPVDPASADATREDAASADAASADAASAGAASTDAASAGAASAGAPRAETAAGSAVGPAGAATGASSAGGGDQERVENLGRDGNSGASESASGAGKGAPASAAEPGSAPAAGDAASAPLIKPSFGAVPSGEVPAPPGPPGPN